MLTFRQFVPGKQFEIPEGILNIKNNICINAQNFIDVHGKKNLTSTKYSQTAVDPKNRTILSSIV